MNSDLTCYVASDVVDILIASGANEGTALIEASRNGKTKIVELLIHAGTDPNGQSSYGYTGLMMASYSEYTEIVKLLLKAGANPNIRSNRGESALIIASRHGYAEIVKLLKNQNEF